MKGFPFALSVGSELFRAGILPVFSLKGSSSSLLQSVKLLGVRVSSSIPVLAFKSPNRAISSQAGMFAKHSERSSSVVDS